MFITALEAVVLGDASRFSEMFTDDVVFSSPHLIVRSLDAVQHALGSPEDSLTDVRIVVLALDSIDDKVFAEWRRGRDVHAAGAVRRPAPDRADRW